MSSASCGRSCSFSPGARVGKRQISAPHQHPEEVINSCHHQDRHCSPRDRQGQAKYTSGQVQHQRAQQSSNQPQNRSPKRQASRNPRAWGKHRPNSPCQRHKTPDDRGRLDSLEETRRKHHDQSRDSDHDARNCASRGKSEKHNDLLPIPGEALDRRGDSTPAGKLEFIKRPLAAVILACLCGEPEIFCQKNFSSVQKAQLHLF
jgi:hypothetical protein